MADLRQPLGHPKPAARTRVERLREAARLIAQTALERRRWARESVELATLTSRELRDVGLSEYEAHVLRKSPVPRVAQADIDALMQAARQARAEAFLAALRWFARWARSIFLNRPTTAGQDHSTVRNIPEPRA